MFSVLLVPLLAAVLFVASVRSQRPNVDPRVTAVVLGGYLLRLAIAPLAHSATPFTTGGAVDSSSYERFGEMVSRMWDYNGIQLVGSDDFPNMALPVNIFALVQYLNRGPAHLGCVAIVAAAASLVCLDVYLMCVLLGARRDVALRIAALVSVLPSFLYYTSDTYKDGFVAFFVIGLLACSVRLSRKFSIAQILWALVLLRGLWLSRYYLVYVMPAPLLLGLLGLRSGSVMRLLLAGLVVGTSVTAAYAYSDVPTTVTHHAVQTFQTATSQVNAADNASHGSGVTFEEDAPLGAFPAKLAYTLFAPFPWQSGSMGLQLAKLEVVVWYFFFYRAMRAARTIWRERLGDLLVLLSFIVPMTIAYAFSFANIGLMVRERMTIVLATVVFASISWSASPVASTLGEVARRASVLSTRARRPA